EAVSSKADVWFNGAHLGQHRGGYTAFEFEVTELAQWGEDNLLVVRASNENDSEIAPWMAVPFGSFPQSSDYAVYGGIYRDVWLVERDSVSIRAHFHDTPEVSAARGMLAFRTSIENASSEALEVSLVTEVLDSEGALVESGQQVASIGAGSAKELTGELTLDEPQWWSPEHPYLYTVRSRVLVDEDILDEVENPLGFRWYSLKNGSGFVLNGEESFLKGVNRHQDQEGLGYALPNEQHQRDVELIKGMGFNFVRHAHYPADEAFLRACDEAGLMVWL